MTWLLTVDPGKNGCGCALWQQRTFIVGNPYAYGKDKVDWVLHAAEYVQPFDAGFDHEVRLPHSNLADICNATARAVVEWTQDRVQEWCKQDLRQSYVANWRSLSLACELPRTYGGRAKKGDANDNVVPLSVVVGMIAGALGCPTALVWPQDWKKTIPKPETKKDYDRDGYIVEGRALAALTPEEKARIVWPSKGSWKLRMDVADALGIGLWHLKRAFR